MKKLTRIAMLIGLLGAAAAAASCTANNNSSSSASASGSASIPGSDPAKKAVKVGLICLHDETSTYDKNFIDSMTRAVANLGAKVDGAAIIKTGVDESEDAYNAAKDLVRQGCNVIFADSFGHESYILDAAEEYPNVTFCHATGTKAKIADVDNFHNAFASIYEGRYLAGYAAGLKLQRMIDGNELAAKNYDANQNIKLGYVGAYPYAEVVSGYTSWYLGVKAVVPNVVMDVTYTSSWYDFNAEKASARTLGDAGAAIISQHADSMGAPGECETMGIPNVTYNVPTAKECPTTYLAYSKIDWAPYYEAVVNAVYNGTAIEGEVNNNWTGTIGTGSVIYDCANATDKAAVEAVKAELVAGTRKVFDCANFTVNGAHLTEYLADVDDEGDFVPETNVIKTEGGKTFFDESSLRSAPYFDVRIDGITELNARN